MIDFEKLFSEAAGKTLDPADSLGLFCWALLLFMLVFLVNFFSH